MYVKIESVFSFAALYWKEVKERAKSQHWGPRGENSGRSEQMGQKEGKQDGD